MILSNLLSLFKKKPDGYATPWLSLNVVHAVALDGLTPDQAYGLRAQFLRANTVDFTATNGAAYTAYFRDSENGAKRAVALVESLHQFGRELNVPAFGVGAARGECLVNKSAKGGFESPPVGEPVTQAVRAAHAEAAPSVG